MSLDISKVPIRGYSDASVLIVMINNLNFKELKDFLKTIPHNIERNTIHDMIIFSILMTSVEKDINDILTCTEEFLGLLSTYYIKTPKYVQPSVTEQEMISGNYPMFISFIGSLMLSNPVEFVGFLNHNENHIVKYFKFQNDIKCDYNPFQIVMNFNDDFSKNNKYNLEKSLNFFLYIMSNYSSSESYFYTERILKNVMHLRRWYRDMNLENNPMGQCSFDYFLDIDEVARIIRIYDKDSSIKLEKYKKLFNF